MGRVWAGVGLGRVWAGVGDGLGDGLGWDRWGGKDGVVNGVG